MTEKLAKFGFIDRPGDDSYFRDRVIVWYSFLENPKILVCNNVIVIIARLEIRNSDATNKEIQILVQIDRRVLLRA